ncbi:hypothetical protein AURDEDRAFT_166068 [Auricularia subglabra TFB-10046 SS5]|nr:hypothetical protein AURDEDRAFT_166068 [Auricularia subglabra TFB-10046 SS5]
MAWHVALLPESDEIAAIARTEWVEDALAAPLEPVSAVPFGGPEQAAFFNELDIIHRRVMQSKSHYCVHILATKPAHQGKGAAASLLQHIGSTADARKVPVYLEATPIAVPVYKKLGWRETGEILKAPIGVATDADPQRNDAVITVMLREPVS